VPFPWNLRVILLVELAVFAVFSLIFGVADGALAAAAALFACAAVTVFVLTRTDSPSGIAMRRLLKKKIAVVCLAFIVVFYLSGILAPVLPIPSYTKQDLNQAENGPSWSHPSAPTALAATSSAGWCGRHRRP
jgi:hypothetical protein